VAKADKKKTSKIKVKKKAWFKVLAPASFAKKEFGESYLQSPEQAVGRKLKSSLRDLTGNAKDQNVSVDFQITDANQNILNTKIIGMKLANTYVKRVVKKNTDRVDDFFVIESKDKQQIVLKTLMITLHKTTRSVKSELRSRLGALIREDLSKNTFEAYISSILHHKLQGSYKRKLAKVYPLREVAFRVVFLKEKGHQAKPVAAKVTQAADEAPKASA
jgi:small subunit ribosomal protein S3Ae